MERTKAAMSCSSIFINLFFYFNRGPLTERECKYAHNFEGFANFLPKSLPTHSRRTISRSPRVAEEGFDIGFRDGLAVDLAEAFHQ